MKPFRFHPEALREADEAAKYYEERQKCLGGRFVEALSVTINCIIRTPKLYGKLYDEIRKCRLLRFPYGVIYRDKADFIEIIAVMHLKRKPGYWKSRV